MYRFSANGKPGQTNGFVNESMSAFKKVGQFVESLFLQGFLLEIYQVEKIGTDPSIK